MRLKDECMKYKSYTLDAGETYHLRAYGRNYLLVCLHHLSEKL